jgi:arsenate reductase (thioredoxin)
MDRIVFACLHNAGRSQIAQAWFNALADPKKARAVSAGSEPAAHLHPEVVKVMREAGFDLTAATPTKLTKELVKDATLLVTMGCGEECPYVPGVEVRDWALPDPKGRSIDEVRALRGRVKSEVERLIAERGWGR